MDASRAQTARVIAPPPLIYLGFLGAGFALEALWPVALLPQGVRYVLGGLLIGAGALVMALALRSLRAARTHVQTWKPTTAIVTGGPYRYSRNPIYLAMSALYAGIGIAADSAWVLVLLAPLLAVVRFGVIGREERYLARRFGDAYLRYKDSVRRWL